VYGAKQTRRHARVLINLTADKTDEHKSPFEFLNDNLKYLFVMEHLVLKW
jgi:hypothetical protein